MSTILSFATSNHPRDKEPEQVDSENEAGVRKAIETIYRREGRRVFASLVRILGEFEFAEEVLQDAFAAALEQWSRDGIPANPGAWLISTGKFKAIDAIRRRGRFQKAIPELLVGLESDVALPVEWSEETFKDDQLRLIFTCCHPALAANTQVALTLREVCGLTTEEIASAFLASPATIAQRIVRGKAKIRDAKIPYQVPARADLPERLDSVLSVIYLVFNEGYSASSGASLVRTDLSTEAIRLGRHMLDLLPDPEVMGLLALMLLHESRREAREHRGRSYPSGRPGSNALEATFHCGRFAFGRSGSEFTRIRNLYHSSRDFCSACAGAIGSSHGLAPDRCPL
jgi:RNA polymerase sigma-70 factor (ECF subfamily)